MKTPIQASRTRRRTSLCGVLRVVGLFGAVGTALSCWSLQLAYGQAETQAQKLGEQLLRNLGPLAIGDGVPVHVNGGNLFLAATNTKLEPTEVVARVKDFCRDHSATSPAASVELQRLVEGRSLPPGWRDPADWTIAENTNDAKDFAQTVCFTRRKTSSLTEYLLSLGEFLKDGELSHLGNMHHVVARRVGHGNTQVLATWSHGSLNARAMFPLQGDAPGNDLATVARPPESTRVLSAELEGRSYSIHMYETAKSPEDTLRFYDSAMKQRSFTPDPVWPEHETDKQLTATPGYARAFTLPRGLLVITAFKAQNADGVTQVSLLELGSPGSTGARGRDD